VNAYLAGHESPGEAKVAATEVFRQKVLVPTYYDDRYNTAVANLLRSLDVDGVTIGELLDDGLLFVRGGHGSPSNDQRQGHIAYVKVSDIRGLRINVNPTNLVSEVVARRYWRGESSGLEPWDVITPNRASSNIGEFAILLPGEEEVVLTKEVFVFRVANEEVPGPWDPLLPTLGAQPPSRSRSVAANRTHANQPRGLREPLSGDHPPEAIISNMG
jgi:type I restriction enzyme M protein